MWPTSEKRTVKSLKRTELLLQNRNEILSAALGISHGAVEKLVCYVRVGYCNHKLEIMVCVLTAASHKLMTSNWRVVMAVNRLAIAAISAVKIIGSSMRK